MRKLKGVTTLVAVLSLATFGSVRGVVAQENWEGVFTLRNGDVNADGTIDLGDGISLLYFLFRDGPAPAPIVPREAGVASVENGDANGDGTIDLPDSVRIFRWLYSSGPAPVSFWESVSTELTTTDERAEGGGGFTPRPIEDFLDQQGTFCLPIGPGVCLFRLPPMERSYFGTTDPASLLCGRSDYAGVVDEALGGALGTVTRGTVLERPLPDGRAEVRVVLFADNALTWVFDSLSDEQGNFAGCGPEDGPVVFGKPLPETLATGEGALGRVLLRLTFINTAPGAPLPDLLQLIVVPQPGQLGPSEFFLASVAVGPLSEGGTALATNLQIVVDNDGDGIVETPLSEDIRLRRLRRR